MSTHHANVNVRKLVEVFEGVLQTTEQAVNDTKQECRTAIVIIVLPRTFDQCPERLYDRHQETTEANTPERCGCGPDEAVLDAD